VSLEEHESDLMPDADEDPVGVDVVPDEELTGIEVYQASVAFVRLQLKRNGDSWVGGASRW
jgi:hypothetical protein